jgi:hypothetical protein
MGGRRAGEREQRGGDKARPEGGWESEKKRGHTEKDEL